MLYHIPIFTSVLLNCVSNFSVACQKIDHRLSKVLCNSKNALPSSDFVVAMVTSACNHCSHDAMVTGVVLVPTSLLPH